MIKWSCTGSGDIETGKVELDAREVSGNVLEFAMVAVAFIDELDEDAHCDGALCRLIANGLRKEVD